MKTEENCAINFSLKQMHLLHTGKQTTTTEPTTNLLINVNSMATNNRSSNKESNVRVHDGESEVHLLNSKENYFAKGAMSFFAMEGSTKNGETVLKQKGEGGFMLPVTDKWNLVGLGATKLKVHTSHPLRIILALFFVIIIYMTAIVLLARIQKLEAKNDSLGNEVKKLQDKLLCFMAKVSSMQGENLEIPNDGLVCFDEGFEFITVDENEPGEDDDDYSMNSHTRTQENQKRVQRSASIHPDGDRFTENENVNKSGNFSKNVSRTVAFRKRDRGNNAARKEIAGWRLNVLRLKQQRKQDQASLAKLKLKLLAARNRAKTAKSLADAYKLRSDNASLFRNSDPRAVYLTVRDSNININKPEQLIGPWHIAASGKDIGFNDLWYNNLALDYNATSVMFQENGLYLIYAQVFYKSTLKKKEKVVPMGFKILLKKNQNNPNNRFVRPIPIAECVPSFPTTYYQTCFTQICWYIEDGDQVYLEHFTEALPVIEAEKKGQTFLGIVRLSP